MSRNPPRRTTSSAPEKPSAKRAVRRKKEAQGVDLDAWLVSSLKLKIGIASVALLLVLIGLYVTVIKPGESPEARAKQEVQEAQDLSTRAATSPNLSDQKKAYDDGQASLALAKNEIVSKNWDAARNKAIDAQGKFKVVISSTEAADGQFQEVEGTVQVQHGSDGTWTPARIKMPLNDGDFVKTGRNGSAEIRYSDGQIQTVQHDTLFEFKKKIDPTTNSRKNQYKMDYGVIDVLTPRDSSSQIITPNKTIVDQGPETKGNVEIGPDKAVAYSVFQGKGSVSSPRGEKVDVTSKEKLKQRADLSFQPKMQIPDTPNLVNPADNAVYDMKATEVAKLSWMPVANSRLYHLQVSKSRFFVQPEVDVSDRNKTEATIKILSEGSYFWRVAGVSTEGARGEFTIPRKFKFTTGEMITDTNPGVPGVGRPAPKPPPVLTMDDSTPIGNLWLLSGQTDPGAIVSINGEPVNVDASGKWSFSYSFKKVGQNQITIKATNGGAEAKIQKTYIYSE